MSTRSHIGKKQADGTVKYIYCHFDGYPEHNGKILKEHYTNEAKIDTLLELGDISILGPEIGEQQKFNDFGTHHPNWCLAYGRDRGQNDVDAKIASSIEDMIFWQDYHYVWNNGTWECYSANGDRLSF